MKRKFTYKLLTIVLIITSLLCGCTGTTSSGDKDKKKTDDKNLTLGGTNYSKELLELYKTHLEKKGYTVKIMLFEGNQVPATACMDGEVDAIIQNHKPWMEVFNKEQNANLAMLEPHIYYSRAGLYSKKYTKLEQIPEKAKIAVPGDPANLEHSLLFLQDMGLIKLGKKTGEFFSLIDITENTKNIQILETEIMQTIRSIDDVDAIICGAKSILDCGMDPASFIVEDKNKKGFPLGFIMKKENLDQPWTKEANEFMKTQEFKDGFNEIFKNTTVLFE